MEAGATRDTAAILLVIAFAALIAFALPTGAGVVVLTVFVAMFGMYAFFRSPGREPPNVP